MKGSAEEAAKHQHGVQAKLTGTTGSPITEERFAALEARVAELESVLKKFVEETTEGIDARLQTLANERASRVPGRAKKNKD